MQRVNLSDRGECMALVFSRDGRPCIIVGPVDDPDSAELLYVGPRFFRERSAQRHGKAAYFRLYFERYGFRHPEDPRAIPGTVMPASVLVMKGDDHTFNSQTYDPDKRTH
jgi:hypothetical protein